MWADVVAEDVILATHLNGTLLDDRHGAPLRLVAPSQYGYKSVKHLIGIDFRDDQPALMSKEHLRARVAAEGDDTHAAGFARLRVPYRLNDPPDGVPGRTGRRRQGTIEAD